MLAGALLCLGLVASLQTAVATSSQYLLRNHSSTLFASTTIAAAEEVTVGMHAAALGQYLQGLMDREVGAPLLQSLLNQLPYSSHPRNDSQTVFDIATALEARVAALTSMIRELQDVSQALPSFPASTSCCSLPPGQARHHTRLGIAVQERLCEISSLPAVSPTSKIVQIPSKLTSLLRQHLSTPGLLWQVFLDPSGREMIYPSPRTSCTSTSPHSHLLPVTLNPLPRRTIILLDTAAPLSASQFRLAISAARHLLSSLNPLDQAAVFLTSTSRALSPLNCQVGASLLPPSLLLSLLDQLVDSSTNAPLLPAFTSALSVLFNSTSKPLPAQIVVISTLSRLTAASSSLQHATASLPSTAIAAVVLQPLGLPQTIPLTLIQPHYVISINTQISSALEGWYQAPSPPSSLTPHFTSSQVDPLTSLPTVALTLPSPIGVVGLIVDLRALAEEVIFRTSTGGGRVFLLDSEGKLVAESGPAGGNSTKFEPEKLSSQLQTRPNGRKSLGHVDYTWRKVKGSPFSVVLASPANSPKEVGFQTMKCVSNARLFDNYYHF